MGEGEPTGEKENLKDTVLSEGGIEQVIHEGREPAFIQDRTDRNIIHGIFPREATQSGDRLRRTENGYEFLAPDGTKRSDADVIDLTVDETNGLRQRIREAKSQGQ